MHLWTIINVSETWELSWKTLITNTVFILNAISWVLRLFVPPEIKKQNKSSHSLDHLLVGSLGIQSFTQVYLYMYESKCISFALVCVLSHNTAKLIFSLYISAGQHQVYGRVFNTSVQIHFSQIRLSPLHCSRSACNSWDFLQLVLERAVRSL